VNWPFQGKHNADMALSENEFDNFYSVAERAKVENSVVSD